MFSFIWLIIQIVIWAFTITLRLMIIAAQMLWEIALKLIPPLAVRFGEAHEKNKRRALIESVPSEKWGDCFNRLLEYRDICFGDNNAEARTFDGNMSVRYQMEQAVKGEFGMDIAKYMKDNDVDKLNLLILDMEQYILGNIQPSKKYLKMNGAFEFKKRTTDNTVKTSEPKHAGFTDYRNRENAGKTDGYSDGFNRAEYNNPKKQNGTAAVPGYFADCANQNDAHQRFEELKGIFNPSSGSAPNETIYQEVINQYEQTIKILTNG